MDATISQNTYEHSVVHKRKDGQRLEMSLIHLPGKDPVFQSALFPMENNSNCEPSAIGPELSLEEVQLQYALLGRLKEAGYLT